MATKRNEIYEIKNHETVIDIAGNNIQSIKEKRISKKGARVFKDNQIFSSSYVGEISNDQLIKDALTNTDGAIPYKYELNPIKSLKKEHHFKVPDAKDFYATAVSLTEKINKEFSDFVFSGKLRLNQTQKIFEALDEGKLENIYDSFEFELGYKHKSSNGIIDGFFMTSSINELTHNKILEQITPFLNKFEHEAEFQNKKIPVLFLYPDEIFGKLLSSCRGDTFHTGTSLLKDKLNELVFHKDFTLIDVSYDLKQECVSAFDGEGVVRKNPTLNLIENGVFKNCIYDLRNAAKFGTSSTGNGLRTYDRAPSLFNNSIRVKPGSKSVKDILRDIPECIIIETAIGGEFNDLGDYSTPVQNAFMARNGEIVGKMPQVTVNSNIFKMFGEDLIDIASGPMIDSSHIPGLIFEMDCINN